MALRAGQRTIGRRYYLLPTNNTRAAGRLFQMVPMAVRAFQMVPIALRAFQKFQVVPMALRAFQ